MVRTAKKQRQKSQNGAGESITVFFDKHDPAERRALEASQLLAAKHGRRKQAIVALLEAVFDYYEATGELMTTAQIISSLTRQPMPVISVPVRFFPTQTGSMLQPTDKLPGVVIAEGRKTDAKTVADNFLRDMTIFFD